MKRCASNLNFNSKGPVSACILPHSAISAHMGVSEVVGRGKKQENSCEQYDCNTKTARAALKP